MVSSLLVTTGCFLYLQCRGLFELYFYKVIIVFLYPEPVTILRCSILLSEVDVQSVGGYLVVSLTQPTKASLAIVKYLLGVESPPMRTTGLSKPTLSTSSISATGVLVGKVKIYRKHFVGFSSDEGVSSLMRVSDWEGKQ